MQDIDKIHEISKGIGEHLRKNETFVDIMLGIQSTLDQMIKATDSQILYEIRLLRQEVSDIRKSLSKYGLPETSRYEKELEELRTDWQDTQWPDAVDPRAICRSAEDAVRRAEATLDMLVTESITSKKILDFGCGSGEMVHEANKRGGLALGFDVNLKQPGDNLTDNWEQVVAKAPYNIIVLNDVLDHVVLFDPIEILRRTSALLAPKGRMYVRNHPWSSRTGGHLYSQSNKAFLHLVFDDVELARIGGLECEHNIRVVTPVETYRYWFEQAGLEIKSELVIRDDVEPYFTRPSTLRQRLLKLWNDNEAEMLHQMEVSFVEFVAVSKDSNQQAF